MGLVACNCGADKIEKMSVEPTDEAVVKKIGSQVEGSNCLEDHSCCASVEEAS